MSHIRTHTILLREAYIPYVPYVVNKNSIQSECLLIV